MKLIKKQKSQKNTTGNEWMLHTLKRKQEGITSKFLPGNMESYM